MCMETSGQKKGRVLEAYPSSQPIDPQGSNSFYQCSPRVQDAFSSSMKAGGMVTVFMVFIPRKDIAGGVEKPY